MNTDASVAPAKEPRAERINALRRILDHAPQLESRYKALSRFNQSVRIREYHLTNACNIRCKGCWFFEFGHDKHAKEATSLDAWRLFLGQQRKAHVNTAIVIGGEPTLFLDRLMLFVETMKYVTISTNGLKPLPNAPPFDNVGMLISLFGGGPLDDQIRAITPSGRRFSGLFDTALANYRDDPRATFVFAVTDNSLPHIEDTVERIYRNGNRVTFNFYSRYDDANPLALANARNLLDTCLAVKRAYPDVVISHPEHIRAIVTGKARAGTFSGDTCPSISKDHPENVSRVRNGHPYIPLFNTYKADLKTLEKCCTSGHCEDCRDSQAVYTWLLVNIGRYLDSAQAFADWLDITESYWSQFIWTPYHPAKREPSTTAVGHSAATPLAQVAV